MKSWKRIANWIFILGYFPIILLFVSFDQQEVICSDVQVVVKDSLDIRFISKNEIKQILLTKYPEILGYKVKNINLEEIENYIENHYAVSQCEVYNTKSGVMHIEVKQHEPILRVFTDRETFYLDKNGLKIQVSKNFATNTLVVNGSIPSEIEELLSVGCFINENSFWKAQIEQIYIRKNNEYILIPRVGDHWILLGLPDDVDKKLRNLKALYTNGLLPQEWNRYKLINLKYENQVICSVNRDF